MNGQNIYIYIIIMNSAERADKKMTITGIIRRYLSRLHNKCIKIPHIQPFGIPIFDKEYTTDYE
jgi:hypothetical protein